MCLELGAASVPGPVLPLLLPAALLLLRLNLHHHRHRSGQASANRAHLTAKIQVKDVGKV